MSTDVSIVEQDAGGRPQQVEITGSGRGAAGTNVRLVFSIDRVVQTDFAMTSTADARTDFLQLSGVYHVTGQTGDRRIDFIARGAAETFRDK
jgi:hypothetical protein